ncbi:MAG: helix-turn-helix transcriptional regulator [Agathobacter sp.]|nr:helix-turn-helix transcriptional regulator [Agathobacter sp.]
MKEKHLSGQAIADKVGTSQKTISRYARGEVTPNEEMQRRILEAIESLSEKKSVKLSKITDLIRGRIPSEEELCELENHQEMVDDLETAIRIFSLLTQKNQESFLRFCDCFFNLCWYEYVLVRYFNLLSEEYQSYLLEDLQNVQVSFKDMSEQPLLCKKISSYCIMIEESQNFELEDFDKFETMSDSYEKTTCTDIFQEKIENISSQSVKLLAEHLEELLSMDAKDWHFLMLVQMMALKDHGVNIYGREVVGDKVLGLMKYMKEKGEN